LPASMGRSRLKTLQSANMFLLSAYSCLETIEHACRYKYGIGHYLFQGWGLKRKCFKAKKRLTHFLFTKLPYFYQPFCNYITSEILNLVTVFKLYTTHEVSSTTHHTFPTSRKPVSHFDLAGCFVSTEQTFKSHIMQLSLFLEYM
jgi:hypothetical protein